MATAALITSNSAAQDCTLCRPQYAPTQTASIALADMAIEKLNVNCNATRCKAVITVRNMQDDTSRETQLVVSLPAETVFRSASGDGSFKLCGNVITFCLDSLNPQTSKTVTIETSVIENPNHKNKEAFGAFVFNSVPDLCPVNNFKSWVNTGVTDDCRRFRHVKTERDTAE